MTIGTGGFSPLDPVKTSSCRTGGAWRLFRGNITALIFLRALCRRRDFPLPRRSMSGSTRGNREGTARRAVVCLQSVPASQPLGDRSKRLSAGSCANTAAVRALGNFSTRPVIRLRSAPVRNAVEVQWWHQPPAELACISEAVFTAREFFRPSASGSEGRYHAQ
jgi:hypothetical protein